MLGKEVTTMTILVAYASKHGSTQEIAERISEKLAQAGKQALARSIETVSDPGSYEAFVIGSAIYYGSWMKEATEWVHNNEVILAARPTWMFSVGPLGVDFMDDEQQPKEKAEFQESIKPRDHQVFFGALDHNKLSFTERMMTKAVRAPEGDYRDWKAIDAWAISIAHDLE